MNVALQVEQFQPQPVEACLPDYSPSRLRVGWRDLLVDAPAWAADVILFPERVGLILEGAKRRGIFVPPLECAALFAVTFFGGEIRTKRLPTTYGKPEMEVVLSLPGARWGTMSIRYFLSGSIEGATGPSSWAAQDYSAANPAFPPHPRAKVAARGEVVRQVRRLAYERGVSPGAISSYVANLRKLFVAIDRTVTSAG